MTMALSGLLDIGVVKVGEVTVVFRSTIGFKSLCNLSITANGGYVVAGIGIKI